MPRYFKRRYAGRKTYAKRRYARRYGRKYGRRSSYKRRRTGMEHCCNPLTLTQYKNKRYSNVRTYRGYGDYIDARGTLRRNKLDQEGYNKMLKASPYMTRQRALEWEEPGLADRFNRWWGNFGTSMSKMAPWMKAAGYSAGQGAKLVSSFYGGGLGGGSGGGISDQANTLRNLDMLRRLPNVPTMNNYPSDTKMKDADWLHNPSYVPPVEIYDQDPGKLERGEPMRVETPRPLFVKNTPAFPNLPKLPKPPPRIEMQVDYSNKAPVKFKRAVDQRLDVFNAPDVPLGKADQQYFNYARNREAVSQLDPDEYRALAKLALPLSTRSVDPVVGAAFPQPEYPEPEGPTPFGPVVLQLPGDTYEYGDFFPEYADEDLRFPVCHSL